MATVTASFAVLILLLLTVLAMNTTRLRFSKARSTDPADKAVIGQASRAHGNTLEHSLPVLLLMFFYEVNGGDIRSLCIVGTVFIVARLVYVYGMLKKPASKPMQLGAGATYLIELILIGMLAAKVF
ncbi:MAG: MAPEG family protein [Nevskiales bacterium]